MPPLQEWVERIHQKLLAEAGAKDTPSTLFAGARPEQIEAIEEELGCALPASYRDFLKISDGWIGFWFGMTLLGTAGPARNSFEEQLAQLTEEERMSFPESIVLGVNLEEDLFLIAQPDSGADPALEVYSIEDGGLESFSSFARLLRALASGEKLPQSVPLELEKHLRS